MSVNITDPEWQKTINRKWVRYDKYDRNTWPQIQDGSREALCELEDGRLEVSAFYSLYDGPRWGSGQIDHEYDVVIRYTDVEVFKYKELN